MMDWTDHVNKCLWFKCLDRLEKSRSLYVASARERKRGGRRCRVGMKAARRRSRERETRCSSGGRGQGRLGESTDTGIGRTIISCTWVLTKNLVSARNVAAADRS